MSAATTQGSQSHALASPTEASTAGIVTASVGDIVIRDRNGEFDIGGVPLGLDRMMGGFGDGEEGDGEIVGCSAEDFEESKLAVQSVVWGEVLKLFLLANAWDF